MVVVEVRGSSYYMCPKSKKIWDNLKDGKLAEDDDDRIYLVDGRERSGKSLWTLQQAAYIDPTLLDNGPNGELLPRITFSMEETLKAIRETKSTKTHTKVIIYDEAFRGMSSKSFLSKQNKAIAQAVQEMGQNNLVMFLVTPRFFMLEPYIATLRSRALFHIMKDKRNPKRRGFKCYNEKKKGLLYQLGIRKGWSYGTVKTQFKDRFFGIYPGGDEFEARYREKKRLALRSTDRPENEEGKWQTRFYLFTLAEYEDHSKSYKGMERWWKEKGIDLTYETIRIILKKARKIRENLQFQTSGNTNKMINENDVVGKEKEEEELPTTD